MKEENETKTLKTLSRVDDVINHAIRILTIPVLICGLYIIMDTIGVYSDAGSARVANYKPKVITEETLQEISGNCVAWLKIDDTTIDYPIMQGKDNMEYLNKDPYGNYSLSGSVFLDSGNDEKFTDEYNLVYGHHMSGNLMFGALDFFSEEAYFRDHLTGTLNVGDDEYPLTVYAFFRCDASHEEVFDPFDGLHKERREFFKNQAWYTNGELKERMIALTTCKTPGATDRTVLILNIGSRQEKDISSDGSLSDEMEAGQSSE